MSEVPPNRSYEPFRRTLKALWREFRRCSLRYPPIYHELVIPPPSEPMLAGPKVWEAHRAQLAAYLSHTWKAEEKEWIGPRDDLSDVLNAVEASVAGRVGREGEEHYARTVDAHRLVREIRERHAHQLESDWEEWHGPDDGLFFGRFTGSPKGLTEFKLLAGSAYRAIGELDRSMRDYVGYHGWLRLIHDIARSGPTPLLCADQLIWMTKRDHGKPGNRANAGGFEYTLHSFLGHNVCVSSMTAIEQMLDENAALLVGEPAFRIGFPDHLALRPVPRISGDIPEAVGDTVPEVAPAEKEKRNDEGIICKLSHDEGSWLLEFGEGANVKRLRLEDSLGLNLYHVLINNENRPFSPKDLSREAGLIGALANGEFGDEMFEAGELGGGINSYEQPEHKEEEYLKRLRSEVEKLKARIQQASQDGDSETQEGLRAELAFYENYIEENTTFKGKPEFGALRSHNEKMRLQNWRRLDLARKQIGRKRKDAAEYLRITTSGRGGVFTYVPSLYWKRRAFDAK